MEGGHLEDCKAFAFIQYEKVGDQHAGRTVCGLNGNDERFGVLLPTDLTIFGKMRMKSQRVLKPGHTLRTTFPKYGACDAELYMQSIYEAIQSIIEGDS